MLFVLICVCFKDVSLHFRQASPCISFMSDLDLQFTQLDLEMSFTDQESIMRWAEDFILDVFDKASASPSCHL